MNKARPSALNIITTWPFGQGIDLLCFQERSKIGNLKNEISRQEETLEQTALSNESRICELMIITIIFNFHSGHTVHLLGFPFYKPFQEEKKKTTTQKNLISEFLQ